jgi:hypothetical protein
MYEDEYCCGNQECGSGFQQFGNVLHLSSCAVIIDTSAIFKPFSPIVQAEMLPLHNLRRMGYRKH